MIMNANRLSVYTLFPVFIVGIFLYPSVGVAQQAQILSVTPQLFQLSINPGEIWQSSVKVVNGNPYEMER